MEVEVNGVKISNKRERERKRREGVWVPMYLNLRLDRVRQGKYDIIQRVDEEKVDIKELGTK